MGLVEMNDWGMIKVKEKMKNKVCFDF